MADLNEKSILISTAIPNPEQPEAMKEYSSKAMALFKSAGGTVLGRHPIVKTILGENPPGVVLLEYLYVRMSSMIIGHPNKY